MGLRDKVTIIGAEPTKPVDSDLSALAAEADAFLAMMSEDEDDSTADDDSDDAEEITDSDGDDIPIEPGGTFDNTPDFDK